MSSLTSSSNDPPVAGEIMLFGVRVVVDSMRKSVSLNNLSQYEQPQEMANNGVAGGAKENAGAGAGKDEVAAPGYTSENDVVHNSGGNRERERKRGLPWTEEEHKLFLVGLQKVGKGDWRGISRNYVKTRTPTQVASHAQKYFLRRNNHNRRRRRSSLFDITTDSVSAVPMEEEKVNTHHLNHHQDSSSQSNKVQAEPRNPICGFSLVPACPIAAENPMETLTLGHQNLKINNAQSNNLALQSIPYGATMADLSLNLKSTVDPSPLSLKLSLQTDPRESSASSSLKSSSSRHSAFQSMRGFNNGDKIISVA